jgi:glycosyltransferase involved in cell wall biosynthesis
MVRPEPTPMKILLVGDFPPPNGGVATHMEELFRAVRARGGECAVLDIGKGQLPADGVVPAGGVARFVALLAWYAARGYRIHLHSNGANPKSWALAAACAAAGRGSAMVTFHSGMGPPWLAGSPARRAVARAVASRFAMVVAVSRQIRDCLVACGVDARRIEIVPAFSREFLQPGAPPAGLAELRARAAPLYCAMLAPPEIYGRDVLLQAFARVRVRLPAAGLTLYGAGTEAISAPGVHAFGQLHRPSALALMASSDVFVRPTLADGDSVSVREALALGRAVVATSVGHRPPEVRLVQPGDAADLARGMIEAASAPRPAAAAADDPMQRVLALYGWETPCAASAAS